MSFRLCTPAILKNILNNSFISDMSSMAEEIQKIHDELNDFIMTEDSENVENLKEALDRTCTGLDAFLKKPSALSVDK